MRQAPLLAGIAMVTGVTLALEVLATRVLSALSWYSLAFLVLAMGMCGLAAGAVRVLVDPERWTPERMPRELAREALRLAWAVPACHVALLIVPLRIQPVWTTAVAFVTVAAALALPFALAGAVVAAALSWAPLPVGRLYAVDLAGAALGAPLVPLLLEAGGPAATALVLGAVAAVAAACFALAGGERRPALSAGGVALLLLGMAALDARSTHGLVPIWAKEKPEFPGLAAVEKWNGQSRLQVSPVFRAPIELWGPGKGCAASTVDQRTVVIDGSAATPLLHPEPREALEVLRCDVSNVAHAIRPHGAVAIIGAGGSRDVQAALLFGHERVVALEVNRGLVELLKGPIGEPTGVTTDPRVQIVADEARSWLARSDERFSVIEASLIDTWAATGAGAHALTENGLYTVEAWRTFLDRLAPNGVVSVTRWSGFEAARLVSLAAAALLENGVVPARGHVAFVAADRVSTLLVSREPLSLDDGKRLVELAKLRGFSVLAAPGVPDAGPRLTKLLGATSRAEIDAAALDPMLDLRPPTDDRPFFFNVTRLSSLGTPPTLPGTGIDGNSTATRALLLALATSLFVALVMLVGPLRRVRPVDVALGPLVAAVAYFTLIGLGFMLVEVALLQRLSIVLGHPSWSLIAVLPGLVAGAGLGAAVSDRLSLEKPVTAWALPIGLAVLVAAGAYFVGAMAPRVASLPTPSRVAFAIATCAVIGAGLGMAFPLGMRWARRAAPALAPWLWGLNGIGGVVGSSLALVLALAYGLHVALLCAAACYLLLVPALRAMQRAVG